MQPVQGSLNAAAVLFLVLHSITDLRERRIYMGILLLQLMTGIAVRYAVGCSAIAVPAAFLPGLAAFVISLLTREALGRGDAYVLLILGVYCPLPLQLAAITMSFPFLWISIAVCKAGRKVISSWPYLPFLLLGYLTALGLYR